MKKMFNVIMITVFSWLCGYVCARMHFGYYFGYRADAPINFIIGALVLGGLIICFLKAARLKPPKIFKTWKMRVCQLMILYLFFMFGVMFIECKYGITPGGWGVLWNVIAILVSIPAILHMIMVIYYYICGPLELVRLRKKIVWLLTKPADDEQWCV